MKENKSNERFKQIETIVNWIYIYKYIYFTTYDDLCMYQSMSVCKTTIFKQTNKQFKKQKKIIQNN